MAHYVLLQSKFTKFAQPDRDIENYMQMEGLQQ